MTLLYSPIELCSGWASVLANLRAHAVGMLRKLNYSLKDNNFSTRHNLRACKTFSCAKTQRLRINTQSEKTRLVITWHCSVCLHLTDFLFEPAQSSHSGAEGHQSGPEPGYWYRSLCPEQKDHTCILAYMQRTVQTKSRTDLLCQGKIKIHTFSYSNDTAHRILVS